MSSSFLPPFSGLVYTISKSLIFSNKCLLQGIHQPAAYAAEMIDVQDQALVGSIGFKH